MRGDALGAHALQKMAELPHYASPALPLRQMPCNAARRVDGPPKEMLT